MKVFKNVLIALTVMTTVSVHMQAKALTAAQKRAAAKAKLLAKAKATAKPGSKAITQQGGASAAALKAWAAQQGISIGNMQGGAGEGMFSGGLPAGVQPPGGGVITKTSSPLTSQQLDTMGKMVSFVQTKTTFLTSLLDPAVAIIDTLKNNLNPTFEAKLVQSMSNYAQNVLDSLKTTISGAITAVTATATDMTNAQANLTNATATTTDLDTVTAAQSTVLSSLTTLFGTSSNPETGAIATLLTYAQGQLDGIQTDLMYFLQTTQGLSDTQITLLIAPWKAFYTPAFGDILSAKQYEAATAANLTQVNTDLTTTATNLFGTIKQNALGSSNCPSDQIWDSTMSACIAG